MEDRESRQENRQRYGFRDTDQARVLIKPRQERPGSGEGDGQHKTAAHIDPEQVACQDVIDVFPLDDRLGNPVQPKVHQKQAKRSDHRHQPEVAGDQETRQHNRGDDLNHQSHASGKQSHASTPNRSPAQLVTGAGSTRPERATGVKGFHARALLLSERWPVTSIRPDVVLCNILPATSVE